MAKLNVPPTKSNLLRIRADNQVASEGYELLEQKREILVMELMSYVERVKRIEKELDKLIFDAYDSLKEAFCSIGHEEVKKKSQFIHYPFTMRKKTVRLLGMTMASVETEAPPLKMQYSFLNTNAVIDKTSLKFLKLITLMCELAEIRTVVWRLSREVKKTQRRVNALEKIVIPDSSETIKFIEETLEERDREQMFVRKMVKDRLEAANETLG
jgi:V/A-type H+-transporting ATPase subunit D